MRFNAVLSTASRTVMTSRAAIILTALSVLVAGDAMGSDLAFDLEAHRGGRALLPENTLPAFANALTMGVDTLELDVGITADGEVIVSHERGLNPDLARDRNGGYIAAPGTPFIKLRLEDSGPMTSARSGRTVLTRNNSPTNAQCRERAFPTLGELFALGAVRQHPRALQHRDQDRSEPPGRGARSAGFCARLLGLIEAEGFSDRVMIQSFDWRTLRLVQQQAPKIPTVYLTLQRGSAPTIALEQGHQLDGRLQSGRSWRLAAPDDQGCGRRDLVALFWRCHGGADHRGPTLRTARRGVDRQQARRHARMIELGVDGIISDRPDLLRQVAGEKGIALPAGNAGGAVSLSLVSRMRCSVQRCSAEPGPGSRDMGPGSAAHR